MAVTTLRPNATANNADPTGTLTASTGTIPNSWSLLNDNLDTTYVKQGGSTGQLSVQADYPLTDFTTPAGSYIRRVRMRCRGKLDPTPNNVVPWLTLTQYPSSYFPRLINDEYLGTALGTAITDYVGPWYTANASGAAWTDTMLTAATLSIIASNGTANGVYFYELYLDVETNVLPTATVTAPTGTISTTSRPQVTFTYSDTESDAMSRYRIKIFTAAQYGAGGFDPNTSASAFDTGWVSLSAAAGSVINVTPAFDHINGTTYKAYVLTTQITDNKDGTTWGISPAYTIATDLPAQPVLTATPDNANGRVTLAFQGRDNELTYDQSTFETSVATYVGTNANLSRVTSQFLDGIASMQMSSVASGNMSASTPTGTSGVPVVVGLQYTALASVKSAASVRSCRVDIVWYTAAGAVISTSNGTAGNDATGSWTQLVCTATAPATAAFAAVVINVLATGAAAEIHFVDQVDIGPGNSTAWTVGGYNVTTSTYIIERSVDGGTTWVAVRGSPATAVPASQQVTIQDYEALPNVTLQYRARVAGLLLGVAVTGPNSATATATSVPTGVTGWWLKDPLDSTKNQAIDIFSPSFKTNRKEEQAVYSPLGRSDYVVVGDVVHTIDGTLEIEVIGTTAAALFEAARGTQHTLLLQRIWTSEQWYVRLGAVAKKEEFNTNPILIHYTIPFVEVIAP